MSEARFETREMTGNLTGFFGIWNPNRRSWVKHRKTDQTPAWWTNRDEAREMCERLNEKFNR